MNAHLPEERGESDGLWLPLTEYSVRSGISLSTIRRKIKNNAIRYRLERGRYLVLFDERDAMALRNSLGNQRPVMPSRNTDGLGVDRRETLMSRPQAFQNEGFTERSFQMISDAFEHSLREKDERILLLEKRNQELEERLTELKLLVHVLEEKYAVRY